MISSLEVPLFWLMQYFRVFVTCHLFSVSQPVKLSIVKNGYKEFWHFDELVNSLSNRLIDTKMIAFLIWLALFSWPDSSLR